MCANSGCKRACAACGRCGRWSPAGRLPANVASSPSWSDFDDGQTAALVHTSCNAPSAVPPVFPKPKCAQSSTIIVRGEGADKFPRGAGARAFRRAVHRNRAAASVWAARVAIVYLARHTRRMGVPHMWDGFQAEWRWLRHDGCVYAVKRTERRNDFPPLHRDRAGVVDPLGKASL